MEVVKINPSAPEYNVKVMKDVLIPMRDGVNLAANLYMPDAPGKFPAVMKYHPYHKDDFSGKGAAVEDLFELISSILISEQ